MSTHRIEVSRAHYCETIVSGTIAPDDRDPHKLRLTTPDGCQFRAAPLGDVSIGAGIGQWRVIPIMQTDGQITRLQIVEEYSPSAIEDDRFICVGRTNQVSRKHNTVTVKIERPGEATIRPTLFDPPSPVKSGQIWQFIAQRVGMTLAIVAATQLDGVGVESGELRLAPVGEPDRGSETRQGVGSMELGVADEIALRFPPDGTPRSARLQRAFHQAESVESRVPNEEQSKRKRPVNSLLSTSELRAIALTALNQQLSRDWDLSLTRVKEPIWEWDARSLVPTEARARVQVNSRTNVARVYLYPDRLNYTPARCLDAATERKSSADDNLDRLIVTPLGAARGIGASCFRVQIGPYEIVMDAGTRPKGSDPLPAFELLERPDLLLITHAHLDHIGALPIFHRDFPDVPTIATHGTREIAHVMLTDGLKVQTARQRQGNEDFQQLFDADDLDRTLFELQTEPVGVDFSPLPGLTARFIHAGHIVGAACIYLQYGNRSILYTGDYNTTSSRTTEGLKLADLPQADILITESTYGSDTHPSRRTQESDLIKAIVEVVAAGGNVLIPAFALGRAQEIILAIRTSALFHSVNVPVYIDGLVREVTDLFQTQLELLPASVQNFAKTQSPFFSDKSAPRIIAIASPKERPLAMEHPSVIIASSGMLIGGASIFYAKTLLQRENAAVFISGYTDEESPGRFLQSLEPGNSIELDGTPLTVRAKIQRFNLSAHADRVGITQVIHRVNPQHLILIHGSQSALHELSRAGDLRDKYWIHIPEVGDTITFGQAPEHLSKAQVARVDAGQEFEVEIEAEFDGAWLRIADSVLADPRWQHLAATGLLSAKWTKGGLMLKPASHKSMAVESAISSGIDCCAVCEFFDGYLCRGEDSPLYKRDVDPAAKCPEFVRQVVTVESLPVDVDLVEPLLEDVDLAEDDENLIDRI
ncbi:MBL fold metallo-hydrolase [Chamaesiphon sp. VAR_69_metabat_338]|uniref:MBL fold metallo-hydrolase n=1 Tax=Chamaesiphon sp. VAR_69_metabat_338 TaxID=2964704 RepID=UPI00286E4A2D|nr:MBL fold metallo-hydrolase [Chamaesiphon sp. VAR_69_metabat_338]